MKFGLMLNYEYPASDSPAQRLKEHVEQVRAARRWGFALIALPHHYSRGPSFWFHPLLMGAHIAPELGDMRLAATVFLLPLTHPVEIAEQVALLDVMSGGRLVFGVGMGWRREEFQALGIPMAERSRRLSEGLHLIRRLWTEECVDFQGELFRCSGVRLLLKPQQKPHPPIWIGANATAASVRRAARLGDAWVVSSHPALSIIEKHLDAYRRELEEQGKPWPQEFPVLRNFYVAETRDAALGEAEQHFRSSYDVFGDWGLFQEVLKLDKRRLSAPELMAERLIIGGPEECIAQIQEHRRRLGVTTLILRMQWLGMEHGKVMRAIELVGRYIIPQFQDAPAGEPEARPGE